MLHEIHNAYLSAAVDEMGAQLMSLKTGSGAQILWQGDPAYWPDRALTLFPFVARLWEGCYEMDAERHGMQIHGLAPYLRFAPVRTEEDCVTLELRSSEATLAQYPRRFAFRVCMTLRENRLETTYEVENLDERMMYFGLGGHPGINVPLEEGRPFEAYRLCFGKGCRPVRVGFSSDCYVDGNDSPFPLDEEGCLHLRHDLFDEDAIVLRDTAREVTLCAPGGSRSVKVSYPDMPYLGIWHMPRTDAPYVCIEPWLSLPANRGEVTVFEEKADLVRLAPGEIYRNTWTMEVTE